LAEKKCNRCGEVKPTSEFHTDNHRPDGKQARCKQCSSELYRAWKEENPDYHKQWRVDNQDRIKEVDSLWRSQNKDRIRENGARWRAENPEHVKEYNREWREENKDEHREATYQWRKNNPDKVREARRRLHQKVKDDPRHKVDTAIRAGMHVGITGGSKAGRKWETLVGYTVDDLMSHLEKQFAPGMTWGNYGRGGWHIDHKIPRSAFNYNTPDDIDFKRCWALENLQPLWEKENISKGAKLERPFQPSLALPA
jgi:hypothetical protein